MSLQPELPRCRQTAGPAADNSDLTACLLLALRRRHFQGQAAHLHNVQGRVDPVAGAVLHAEVRADLAADRARERAVLQHQGDGLVHPALPDHGGPLVRRDARRAGIGAGRQIPVVLPQGLEPPFYARGDVGQYGAVVLDVGAEHAALAHLFFPDLGPEVGEVHLELALELRLLRRRVGNELFPLIDVLCQLFIMGHAVNGLEIGLHVLGEPFPVLGREVHELHVLFAVLVPDGAAEVDRAAHHAHAGPIAQDVLTVPGVDAADHGYAAGLELGEGIAHVAEIP